MRPILVLLCLSCALAAEGTASWPLLDGGTRSWDPAALESPVLLVFWASWCAPCRAEMPGLVELARQAPDLQIVGISVDESAEAARAVVAEQKLPYPIVHDPALAIADGFAVRGTPTLVLLAADGSEAARGKRLAAIAPALEHLGIHWE